MSHAPPDRITADNAWSGLETERVCELTIAGTSASSVDVAKVCLLVMLDELVSANRMFRLTPRSPFRQGGLHAEASEIDHKLHAIVAGRRRAVIQSIQEETSTNIYFPSPLQGLFGPDGSSLPANSTNGSASPRQSSNTIWITGEFFGVQRARDMLYNLSLHQVTMILRLFTACHVDSSPTEQEHYDARRRDSTSQGGLDADRQIRRSQGNYERQRNIH